MKPEQLNPRVRRSLQFIGSLEHLQGKSLEHAVRLAECITPDGKIDVGKMHPETMEVLRTVVRRHLEAGRPVPFDLVDSSGRWNTKRKRSRRKQ